MERPWAGPVASLVETITQLVAPGLETLISNPASFSLPQIPSATAVPICSAASSIFETEPTLLELQGDFIIVGDLHRHVLGLLRISSLSGSLRRILRSHVPLSLRPQMPISPITVHHPRKPRVRRSQQRIWAVGRDPRGLPLHRTPHRTQPGLHISATRGPPQPRRPLSPRRHRPRLPLY